MRFLSVFLLVLVLDLSFCNILETSKSAAYPSEFHLKGESLDLVSGIAKPFEIWYSTKQNKSRIDFYGGVTKYYRESKDNETIKHSIFPIAREIEKNEVVCVQRDFNETLKLNLYLPSIEKFKYSGAITYNNKNVEVWTFVQDDIDTRLEDTVYLDKNGNGSIPVWREIKLFIHWTGSKTSHHIERYYDVTTPTEDDLDVNKVEECNDEAYTVFPERLNWLEIDDDFFSYKMQHNKLYRGDEHEMRKQIFHENLRRIVEHNRKNSSYKMTVNKFSDRTDDELAYLTATKSSNLFQFGSEPFPHTEEEVELMAQDIPENFDLRLDGYISKVKNQAKCGSCWAFAAAATVEGVLARRNGDRELDLSEQSLVDCAWGFYNWGCSGGTEAGVFKYILKHGIPTEKEYGQYLEEDGVCNLMNMTELYHIKGFVRVLPMSVNAMKVALYKYGPITVGINATPIKSYSNGIFYEPACNDKRTNHAVTLVGYGVRDGTPYWIIKNSWGEDWGEDGYLFISANDNNCHILEESYYPII